MQTSGEAPPWRPLGLEGEQAAEALSELLLPPAEEGSGELPGDAEMPFRQRLNAERAAQGKAGAAVSLALGLAALARCWSLGTIHMHFYLVCYSSTAAALLVWQRLHPPSFARWLEMSAAVLALSSSGLGQSWLQMRSLLDAFPVPAPPPATGPAPTLGGEVLSTAHYGILLLFASNSVGMAALCLLLSPRMRFGLALVVWGTVATIAWPFAGLVCEAPCLTHPAARAAQARLHAALSLFSYTLPMPLAPWVRPDAPAMCATLLRFCQLALGTGLPLLVAALAEAVAWQRHARQRRRAGLPTQCGLHETLYDWLSWLTMGGSGAHIAVLAWLLLAITWDWTAFFSVPSRQRGWER